MHDILLLLTLLSILLISDESFNKDREETEAEQASSYAKENFWKRSCQGMF